MTPEYREARIECSLRYLEEVRDLAVKHRANDNGLEFIFEHQLCENAEDDLKILYPKMVKAILLGVRNPEITMGEILDQIKL